MSIIKDVIAKKSQYGGVHYSIILNRPINFEYEEVEPNLFVAEDEGFYTALEYKKGSRDAFAGREITMKMKNGESKVVKDSYWHTSPKGIPLYQVGVASLDELNNIHVFCSACIRADILEDWLKNNDPKLNYYFYQNYPSWEEYKAGLAKWEDEQSHYYHALTSQDSLMRFHCLRSISKKIEGKDRILNIRNSNIKALHAEVRKLIEIIAEKDDITIADEEDFIDILNDLDMNHGISQHDLFHEIDWENR